MKNIRIILLFSLVLIGCSKTSNSSIETSYESVYSSFSSLSSENSLISSTNSSSSLNNEILSSANSSSSSNKVESSSSKDAYDNCVKKWTSISDFDKAPLGNKISTSAFTLVDNFGHEDQSSIHYSLNYENDLFISSDYISNPYFKKGDAKNGYIISLYLYAPIDSNIAFVELQAKSLNYVDELYGEKVVIENHEEEWKRLTVVFDTIDVFTSFKLIITPVNSLNGVKFYLDDIKIEIGTPTATDRRMPDHQSLYKVYEDDFKVGTCVSSYSLRNSTINTLAARNFNSITAENEGKPESILDQNACKSLVDIDNTLVKIKTSPLENIYNYAESHHLKVRHHTLIWHDQTPSWFFNDNYSSSGNRVDRDTMLKRMENFIKTTIETINNRWPGLVYAIDVVNEAIDGGGIRRYGNNWYSTIGSDYVYYAFKFANKYKADYQDLYYNDYSFDYNTNNCSYAVNTLLKKAIEEKLVDGVGIQGHLSSSSNMDNIIKDAKMIYEKGLKCQITELDITISSTDEENLGRQKNAYISLVKKILKGNNNGEININAVILWGISDNYSWKSSQSPLLFDSNIKKKPAYHGFYNAKFEEQ